MNSAWRHLLIVLVCLVSRGFGQAATASPQSAVSGAAPSAAVKVEMPSDPAALLALAAKKNGLQNVSGPWHLKLTYEVLDEKGAAKTTGIFEEFRDSDARYKRSYSSPSFNQTDYATQDGVFRSGDPNWPNEAEAEVQKSLFPFFPSGENLAKLKFTAKDHVDGGVTLRCVTGEMPSSARLPPTLVFCFGKEAPILRISLASSGLYEEVYNRMSSFRGVYVPREILVTRLGKPFLRVRIDVLSDWLKDSAFKQDVPSAAIRIHPRSPSHCTEAEGGTTTRKVPPRYPVEAKSARVQGEVFLAATIGVDGKVAEVRPLAGPPMLIDSSIDAVRQWTYQPCMVDGQAYDVETVVRVVYSIGG
jgi:TonB family protein